MSAWPLALAPEPPSRREAGAAALLAQAEKEAPAELAQLFSAWALGGGTKKSFRAACLPGLHLRGPGPWKPLTWVVVARTMLRSREPKRGASYPQALLLTA